MKNTNKMKKSFFFLVLMLGMKIYAQNYTISGHVVDAQSGEDLLYATIAVTDLNKATSSNDYGFYSITVPKGEHTFVISYLGYQSLKVNLDITKNIRKNFSLKIEKNEIKKIIVSSEKKNQNITNSEVSTINLNIKNSKIVPVLFGEQDVLKTLQLMPGVSASSDGSSGFFVRGGNSDQNLILLDEAPIYNASHLLGFFSVFNSDALSNLKMYKGGIPAKYAGRLSSVTDIRMKNGNMNKWQASGGIGIISSRLTVEGPIIKNKSSIIISGRRTYADLIVKNLKKDFKDLSLYFYDLNAKFNFKINKNNRFFVSGYLGRDAFGRTDMGFDWGNKTATIRWNHIFNNKLFLNTTAIYSDYDYGFDVSFNNISVNLNAGIYDINAKQDYTWYLNANNKIQFGWQSIYHRFKPMSFILKNTDNDSIIDQTSLQKQYALENGFYLSNEQKIGNKITIYYGVHFSTFSNIGPYTQKNYDDNGDILDSIYYKKGVFLNTYKGIEPRINATFVINQSTSIKASYNRNFQYLHLLSNSTSGNPTDMWMPSSPNIKPEFADQISTGFFKNFNNGMFQLSTVVYYKKLSNQLDFKDGADAFANPNIEAEIICGQGKAYGLEFLLKKKSGRLKGWISYTLSKSLRQFDKINFGKWFPARQDRTHDIAIVASYLISKKITISATWVFHTGDAVTFPSGKYFINGNLVNLYSDRNAERMPDYHRLDIGMNWIIKDTKKFQSVLNFSIYNVYNRKNAYSITFKQNETTGKTEAERLSLFGIVPSITWNFKF
jgi:hypothetical protein